MSQTALLKLAKVDKSKYTSQTLSIFDVMACYFLDMFYNALYLKVKDLKTHGKIDNITLGYKSAMFAFHKGLNKKDNLRKCIENIQHIFNELPGYANMSFLDCINKIVEQFSEKDAFEGFNDKQRRTILKTVIVDVNASFIHHIIHNRLDMVIDKRKEVQNVQILKEELIDLFLLERERIISKYYDAVLNIEKTKNITDQTAQRLQQTILRTVERMVVYKKQAEKFEEMARQLKFELDQLKQTQSRNQVQSMQRQPAIPSQPLSIPSQPQTTPVQSSQTQATPVQPSQAGQIRQNVNQPNVLTPIQPNVSKPIQPNENVPDESLDLLEIVDNTESSDKEGLDMELSDDSTPIATNSTQVTSPPKTALSIQSPLEESDDVLEWSDSNMVDKPDKPDEPLPNDLYEQTNEPDTTIPKKPVKMNNITLNDLVIDDPLETDDLQLNIVKKSSGDVKVKKANKINIKRDVPVKKTEFNI